MGKWTDRRQRVVVDGYISNWEKFGVGCHTFFLLGTILYIDFEEAVASKILAFVDDNKLV